MVLNQYNYCHQNEPNNFTRELRINLPLLQLGSTVFSFDLMSNSTSYLCSMNNAKYNHNYIHAYISVTYKHKSHVPTILKYVNTFPRQ